MKLALAVALAAVHLPALAWAETVTEPKSGVSFASSRDGLTLAGVGLRTRTMAKVKIYAVALYVADSAVAGLKGKDDAARLVQQGDFAKEIRIQMVRDLSADQLRGAFRESLQAQGADGAKTEALVTNFSAINAGQEIVLGWAPGGPLSLKVAGLGKSPINDRALAASVFGIWLGDRPIQDDIKPALVSRLQ